MTTAQQQAKQNSPWQALFYDHAASLTAVAEMLLRYRVAPGQILGLARPVLDGSTFDGTFAQVSAVRAVAELATAHSRSIANSVIKAEAHDSQEQSIPGNPRHRHAPWPGHAVLFLSRVLRYFTPGYRTPSRDERRQYRSTTQVF